MSSLSSFSGTNTAANFNVSAANQGTMNNLKCYLCPKCTHSYDIYLRSNMYVGRVPLILNCNHTMCEECIRKFVNKREVVCVECKQPSVVEENDKRKLQEIFPVNFYLMGVIYYSKPNMSEISKLNLKPAGVSYKNRDRALVGSNYTLNSEAGDILKATSKVNIMQEKCSQDRCNKAATLRCGDCVEVYCETCSVTLHRSARGLQKHKITSLSANSTLELTEKCSIHKENILEFHCNRCDVMLCCYCILQNHNGHGYYQLTFLDNVDRPNFDNLVLNAEEKLKKLVFAQQVRSF